MFRGFRSFRAFGFFQGFRFWGCGDGIYAAHPCWQPEQSKKQNGKALAANDEGRPERLNCLPSTNPSLTVIFRLYIINYLKDHGT